MERLDAPPNEEKFRTVCSRRCPNQPGEYVATIPNDRVGRYALKVESGEDTAALDYRVTLPPEHELAPGPMNEERLRKLAEQTGGKFYREEDLYRLPDDVQPQKVAFTQRKETLLWTYWPVWAGGVPVHRGMGAAEVQQHELDPQIPQMTQMKCLAVSSAESVDEPA